jgi:V8-like Glu-specific endopeptidase
MLSANLHLPRFILLCAIASFSISAMGQDAQNAGLEKAAERSGKAFDKQAALAARGQQHDWLMSERITPGQAKVLLTKVTVEEMYEIDMERGKLPVRVGLTKALDAEVSFSDLNMSKLRGRSLTRSHGAMASTADNGYVFTADLGSPDAAALRVHFTGFSLPEGAGLYLYNLRGEVFGPYTGRGPHGDGEFWSHTLVGDSISLQLRQSGPANDDNLRDTRFTVAGLGHIRPRFMDTKGHCSYNAHCAVNASCVGTNTAVDQAKDAVAHMQWIAGAYIYWCTGGLLADTDDSTERPLFLTANHCIGNKMAARNLENFFQLEVPCGTGNCDNIYAHQANHPQELRTFGASILAAGKAGDFTLMELNEPAPDGSAFLGWTSTPVASDNIPMYRISHPSGAPQAYTEHLVDPGSIECAGWPRGKWIYSIDTIGTTEGGSSGSPVVNADGEVVGQLTGGCGYNINDVCDYENNWTVDGALAHYFSKVEEFLDPDSDAEPPPPPPQPCDNHSDCPDGTRCKGKPGNRVCR